MNRFELTDKQLGRLLTLVESDEELHDIFRSPVTNEEKIQRFINTYKLGDHDDCILLGGYEYATNKVGERFFINDFMPSWREIYKEINEKLHDEAYYIKQENKFKHDLVNIGVVYVEILLDEYDNLLSYNLPIDEINNEQWVEKFNKIIKEYKASFNEEMKLIYGE